MNSQTSATDFVSSIIRTITPSIAGWIISAIVLLNLPFQIPATAENGLEGFLTFVFAAVWYFIVRALEEKWPKLGWLLGVAKKPIYDGGTYVAGQSSITSLPVQTADVGGVLPEAAAQPGSTPLTAPLEQPVADPVAPVIPVIEPDSAPTAPVA